MSNRVLIVGRGSMGKRHLNLVREMMPHAIIMILQHRPSEDISDGADHITSLISEALRFGPDIVLIANPASHHISIATAFLHQNCSFFIEKPLATNFKDAFLFSEKLDRAGLIGQVGYNLRFSNPLKEFRKALLSGLIGRPITVRCEVGKYLPSWRPSENYKSSVSARKELGGGALLELSHEIDYLRWIFGEFEWVSGWIGNLGDLDIDVEDSAAVSIGIRLPSYRTHCVVSLNMDFLRCDSTRYCSVIGEQGTLRWNHITGTVECIKHNNLTWEIVYQCTEDRDAAYRAQWRKFLQCIENREQPLVSCKDGAQVLKIVDAIRKSAREGCRQIFLEHVN